MKMSCRRFCLALLVQAPAAECFSGKKPWSTFVGTSHGSSVSRSSVKLAGWESDFDDFGDFDDDDGLNLSDVLQSRSSKDLSACRSRQAADRSE